MRNDIDLEFRAVNGVDGQAHAIHANRTFFRDIFCHCLRRLDPELYRPGRLAAIDHNAHPVHVATHQMPTQRGRQRQGLFKIHGIAGVPTAQRGA